MGGISGTMLSLKWGGITFHPSGEEPEIEQSGRDYETSMAGDGDLFTKATVRPGYFKDTVKMTEDEYRDFKKLQDGKFRSGTGTTANGKVIFLNCAIEGECPWKAGEVELTLSGKVRIQ